VQKPLREAVRGQGRANMACGEREKSGMCSHRQCGFPEKSGWECVDIAEGYCECGEGCHKKCPFAYKQ